MKHGENSEGSPFGSECYYIVIAGGNQTIFLFYFIISGHFLNCIVSKLSLLISAATFNMRFHF